MQQRNAPSAWAFANHGMSGTTAPSILVQPSISDHTHNPVVFSSPSITSSLPPQMIPNAIHFGQYIIPPNNHPPAGSPPLHALHSGTYAPMTQLGSPLMYSQPMLQTLVASPHPYLPHNNLPPNLQPFSYPGVVYPPPQPQTYLNPQPPVQPTPQSLQSLLSDEILLDEPTSKSQPPSAGESVASDAQTVSPASDEQKSVDTTTETTKPTQSEEQGESTPTHDPPQPEDLNDNIVLLPEEAEEPESRKSTRGKLRSVVQR